MKNDDRSKVTLSSQIKLEEFLEELYLEISVSRGYYKHFLLRVYWLLIWILEFLLQKKQKSIAEFGNTLKTKQPHMLNVYCAVFL
jgi:hypothetical protein